MTVQFKIPEAALDALDKKLAGLSGLHQAKALLDGMRAAGRVVRDRAKELAPKGTEKRDHAPLKTTPAYKVKAFVRDNEPVLEVRVKAARRAPHLHLVELGHEIVVGGTVPRKSGGKTPQAKNPQKTGKGVRTGRMTKPTQFLSEGGKYSEAKQKEALNAAAIKAISKLIGA